MDMGWDYLEPPSGTSLPRSDPKVKVSVVRLEPCTGRRLNTLPLLSVRWSRRCRTHRRPGSGKAAVSRVLGVWRTP